MSQPTPCIAFVLLLVWNDRVLSNSKVLGQGHKCNRTVLVWTPGAYPDIHNWLHNNQVHNISCTPEVYQSQKVVDCSCCYLLWQRMHVHTLKIRIINREKKGRTAGTMFRVVSSWVCANIMHRNAHQFLTDEMPQPESSYITSVQNFIKCGNRDR